MTKLRFANAGVRRCIEHALAAPDQGRAFGDLEPSPPSLVLVKDDGIYLVSSGLPFDQDETRSEPYKFCVYAEGYDPRRGDVWQSCQEAVGGDDFCESLPIDAGLTAAVRAGAAVLIEVTETELRVFTEEPAAVPAGRD